MEERMRIDKEKDASVSMNLNALIRRQPSNQTNLQSKVLLTVKSETKTAAEVERAKIAAEIERAKIDTAKADAEAARETERMRLEAETKEKAETYTPRIQAEAEKLKVEA